jgi:hypothetical protein
MFIGPEEEIECLYEWMDRTGRYIFKTNFPYLKKIDGRMRHVCIDCFYYFIACKKAAFVLTKKNELGMNYKITQPKKIAMTDYEVDFWMRSMIDCYKKGL